MSTYNATAIAVNTSAAPSRKTPSKKEIKLRPFHPLADMFPLMQGHEFDELVSDIERRGLLFAITVFDGQIVDGRNRALACQKAGVEPTYTPFQGTAEDLPQFIVSVNIHRRHLKPDQRRDLIKKLLKLGPEQSNRAVAAIAKADDKTVATVRREMVSTAEIPQLKKTVGRDGRSRSKPANKLAKTGGKSPTKPPMFEGHIKGGTIYVDGAQTIVPQPVPVIEAKPVAGNTKPALQIEAARDAYAARLKLPTNEEKKSEVLKLLKEIGLVLKRDFVEHLTLH